MTSAALSPSGTMIRKARPTLRWRPSKGATNYVVKVYDADRNEVATSDLKGTSWTVPVIPSEGERIRGKSRQVNISRRRRIANYANQDGADGTL